MDLFFEKIIEYQGNICFLPINVYCFLKCISFLTGEDYKQQYLDFIRKEKKRSNIITEARIQLF